jgi:hypothetical protein
MFGLFKKKRAKDEVYTPLFNYVDLFKKNREILELHCSNAFESWKILSTPKLRVGDIVTLDKYNLAKGGNGWDGGARLIDTKDYYPFDIEILSVSPNIIFAYDNIERYLRNTSRLVNNETNLINEYVNYCTNILSKNYTFCSDNIYGFYYEITYKPVDSNIKITAWSLNEKCFLLKDSDLYAKTNFIWKLEIDARFKMRELNEARKELDNHNKYIESLKII